MNSLEFKFLELHEEQIETVYAVCQYINETINLDDFNLYSHNFCIDRDTFVDEINLKIISTGKIHVLFGSSENLADDLPSLHGLFYELNIILKSLVNNTSEGIYYLSSNTYDEFKSQFV